MTADVRPLAVPQAALGEGPCWDDRADRLIWVDISASTVHHYAPSTGVHHAFVVDQTVSAALPRAAGGLALAVRNGFVALTPDTGVLEPLAEVEADRPGNRMNDGKCDRSGRFFAGTKADDDAPGAGALYRLDLDRTVTRIGQATISNGLGWSPDERLMYYVDTPTGRVDVFDYDADSGEPTGRRVFAEVPTEVGVPDGLTVDAHGFVWVAVWGGAQVRRYDPTGRLDRVVTVPVSNVTSCAFGGADLDVLYITTASDGLSPARRAQEPLAGAVFQCRPGVTGQPTNPYRG